MLKVGVLLGDKLPEEGGGYTFEHDILQALIKLEAETDHTFVVFTQAKTAPALLLAPAIELRSLHRSWVSRTVGQLAQALRALIKHVCRQLYQRPGARFHILHWAEPAIRRSGVDVMWHLTPTWLTAEVPAIIVVWELQHRLQPYFPEMSARGEWDERDRSYGTILRRAAYVIAGTQAGQAEIERFYQVAPERIKRLPHPTPRYALEAPPGDGREALERFRIPSDYIFYPAQFWAHKNHANLLLALRWLRSAAQLDLPLVLAGSDKGNETYVRQLVAELDLGSQVHFIGFVTPADLIALYRQASCLAYMSFCGPENLPPLEAFAVGCPVVAADVAGTREQLGDAALLVDPGSPEQIGRAIQSLVQNAGLRQTLAARGRKRATERTGEHFVEGVFNLLDEFEPIRRSWSPALTYQSVKEHIRKD